MNAISSLALVTSSHDGIFSLPATLGRGKELGYKGEFVRNEKETLWMMTEAHGLSRKLITGAFPTVKIFGMPNSVFVRNDKL